MFQGLPNILNNIHVWKFKRPMKVSKIRRVLLEPLSSKSVGCLRTCLLSESSLDVSEIQYHVNCTLPLPSQRLHSLNRPLLTCRIYGFMGFPHICTHPSANAIEYETPLNEQHVFSQQQSSGGVGGHRCCIRL